MNMKCVLQKQVPSLIMIFIFPAAAPARTLEKVGGQRLGESIFYLAGQNAQV